MLISQSTIATFDRCRRKWWLKHYRQLGQPKDYRSPTNIGSLVHGALEQYYLGAYGGEPSYVDPIQYVKETAVALIGEYPDFAEEIAHDAEYAGIMVDGYMDWLTETGADSIFDTVEPEREIRAQLWDGIDLIGKLDGKVRTTDGWTGFLEHKTVQNFTDLPAYAQINRQILTYNLLEMLDYLNGFLREKAAGSLPREVAGVQPTEAVVVPLVRKTHQEDGSMVRASQEQRHDRRQDPESSGGSSRMSREPSQQGSEATDIGSASSGFEQGDDGQGQGSPSHREDEEADGRFATSTLGTDVSGEAQGVRAEDLTRETGAYLARRFRSEGAILNMLRKVKRTASATPPFYARHVIQHNVEELRNHWRHVLGIALEIRTATERLDGGISHQLVAPPTPARDCRYSCEFFAVCPLFDDGSDVESVLEFEYTHVDPMERYSEEVDA